MRDAASAWSNGTARSTDAAAKGENVKSSRWLLIAAALGAASCSSSAPPPVPVTASPAQLQALAGTWAGTYSSQATGRYGNIRFSLAAGSDSAHGDVYMVPSKTAARPTTGGEGKVVANPAMPSTLRISFVQASGDSVLGKLEPYMDPDCHCMLETWFTGRLHGDRIQGGYTSRNVETGERSFGEWNVRRQKAETKTSP